MERNKEIIAAEYCLQALRVIKTCEELANANDQTRAVQIHACFDHAEKVLERLGVQIKSYNLAASHILLSNLRVREFKRQLYERN